MDYSYFHINTNILINNTIHLKPHEEEFKKKIINFILISITKNQNNNLK